MKRIFLFILAIAATLSSYARISANDLWLVGSAVPCGIQKMEFYPDKSFKYFGMLNEGELYIITTEQINSSTSFIAPQSVNQALAGLSNRYTTSKTQEGSAWTVLKGGNDYRISIKKNGNYLNVEQVVPWADLYIVGGALAGWDAKKMERFSQDPYNPYVWTWVGRLQENPEFVEPLRIKLQGQRDWNPKGIHPYNQDEPILSGAIFCSVDNTPDNKWKIGDNGYYRLRVDIFRQTFNAEYLGNELGDVPDIANPTVASITAADHSINICADEVVDAKVFDLKGSVVSQRRGSSISITGLSSGIYIVEAEGSAGLVRKKVSI